MKRFIPVVIALIMLFCLASCGDSGLGNDVYISEIMSQNTKTIADETGAYCDWIELYNPTQQNINLAGYVLADNSNNRFTFPTLTLKTGECLVLFADGVEKVDLAKNIIHVPLSIGARGEGLYLYNADGKLVCRFSVPALEADKSCGIDENEKLAHFDTPTPGKPNFTTAPVTNQTTDAQNTTAAADGGKIEGGLRINEYSTNSTETLMDDEGEFVSWVEIYNGTEKEVNLKGYSLSDDKLDKQKWIFPEYRIAPGGYGVVYLSGKDKAYGGGRTIHCNFKLNGKEETLYLFSKTGHVADEVSVYELFSNLTCGRTNENPDKFAFFARPTPGRKNAGTHFDSVESARYTGNRELAITEVAAVNTTKEHTDGEYYDFIEIYNSSKVNINLANYKLSDSKKAESFKPLPQITLAPGEYLAVYCGDEDYVSDYTGDVYVSFGLNRYGETVYLLDKYNVVVDALKYGRAQNGYSSGRLVDGNGDTVWFKGLTPGAVNLTEGLDASLPNPEISVESGYVTAGTTVEISVPFGEVHVTVDGSIPTENSPVYRGPITVSRSGVIRARNFAYGYVPSDTVCATYLVTDRKHDLPVVFLTTDENNLYDYSTGIWAMGAGASAEFPYEGANFWQNWEKPVHFEYMTPDGVAQVAFDAGISVFGQYSRAQDQKSVEIKLKDKYGPTKVCYPFFGEDAVNVFSSFILRNSGQDYNNAHIRDAFASMAIKGQMDIDIMDYQPVVCYVNGKYHGIYDMREKIDEDYLANNHGADPDNVDLIKSNSDVKEGTFDNYDALLNFVKTNDLSVDANYQKVCQWVDIDELINYWMCESFFTNTDTGNIKFWRENTDGARWRWIFFDVDWCLNSGTYDYNLIDNYLDPEGHGVAQAFSTTLYINLYKNPAFRTRMLEIFSQHLNTTFNAERLIGILDGLTAEIEKEMPYHLVRWDDMSVESWKSNVETLKKIIVAKRKLFPSQIVEGLQMTQAEIQKYLPGETL